MASNNRVVIICVSSALLVAMVVAVVGIVAYKNAEATAACQGHGETETTTTSMKAVKAICQAADYKETCEKSLSAAAGNTTDPNELIKVGFKAAVKEIRGVIEKSTLLQQAAKDLRTAQAYKTCQKLLELSIDDIQQSFNIFNASDITKLGDYVFDLKIWLSGAITFQETCLDVFENTTGYAGEEMKKVLKTSREITINGLAMVSEVSKFFSTLMVTGFSRRRLLSGYPSWVKDGKRSLLQATPATIRPDVVVAKDGSGKYKTLNEALKDVPQERNKTFVIYIKAGVYAENVLIKRDMTNVMLIGDGPTKTKITGNKSAVGGDNIFMSPTVGVDGYHFIAKDLGFENKAGSSGHQAVALRISADYSIVYNCQIDGYQDTLFAHNHRQFYRDCTISGTIDFIFGDAAAVFQNCKILVRRPDDNQSCMITAQGRSQERMPTGIVLQNCVITAEPDYYAANKTAIKSYLGRPWKTFSRTIIMHSQIDSVIELGGWEPWPGNLYVDTCWYAEFGNKGPSADKSKRVKWPGIKDVSSDEAGEYTPGKFISGDEWIPSTGVPYISGMMSTT